MAGATLKQLARAEFWRALDTYKLALAAGVGIVEASLRVHAALGRNGVPKSYGRYVRAAFRASEAPA